MPRTLPLVLASLLLLPLVSKAAEYDSALHEQVRKLIWEVAVPNPRPGPYEFREGKQQQLFEQLVALGPRAAP